MRPDLEDDLARCALDESAALLTLAMRAAHAGHWAWDMVTGAAYWSPEYAALIGVQVDARPSYDNWVDALHPDDRDRAVAGLWAAVEARREIDLEFRVVRTDGESRWIAARGRTTYDADGRPMRMIGVSFDVTERKQAEEVLRNREAELARALDELAALMDATPAAIWIAHDPDCKVVTGSRAAHEILRMTPNPNVSLSAEYTAATAPFSVRHDGVTLQLRDLPLRRAVRGDEVRNFEEAITFVDGTRVDLYGNAVPLRDAAGVVRGAIGAFVDITPIKTAEAAQRASEARLRESEERLRLATQAAAVGVWSWDVASDRLQGTDECHAILGIDHLDANADAIRRMIHLEDVDRVWAAVADAIADQKPYECEFRILRPDGAVRWVVNLGRVDYDAGRVLGIVMDVTDRKTAERSLREADRRKDEFLAIIAHELRNPLAPIRNAVRVAQRLDGADPRLRHMHDVIERQAEQLTRIVEDLLDVAQIAQGRVVLRRERLDVVSIVARAIETSRPLLDAHGHRFSVTLPPDPLRVDGDLARLSQVLSNLLNNAAKYTEPGGRIWLTAEADDDEVRLRVGDDGIGIAPDALERIFDLFVQADRTLDRAQGGFGIGLTLVRRLVELHGGRVEAASPGLGGGSEFVVHLPKAREATQPRESAGPPLLPIAPAAMRRVLVVDDNPDAAESLALLLQTDGHDVRVAHEGDAAIETARGFRPQVVLLDIGLPGMSGYEVARRLRVEPDASASTLVALTGYGQREDRQRTSAAGFDHHLTKPVDYETLRTLLGTLGDLHADSPDADFD